MSAQGDGFDEIPPLDEEWVRQARRREESADERAERLRRIAAEHERLQRQQEADRRTALTQAKRDRARPWIIGAVIIAALVMAVVIF